MRMSKALEFRYLIFTVGKTSRYVLYLSIVAILEKLWILSYGKYFAFFRSVQYIFSQIELKSIFTKL